MKEGNKMVKHKSRLKKIRLDAGLTLEQVVEATGISKRTIITIENEEGANPSIDTVKRLIKYFGISFEELYPQ